VLVVFDALRAAEGRVARLRLQVDEIRPLGGESDRRAGKDAGEDPN